MKEEDTCTRALAFENFCLERQPACMLLAPERGRQGERERGKEGERGGEGGRGREREKRETKMFF